MRLSSVTHIQTIFSIQRPGYPHPVCAELEKGGIRVAVGDAVTPMECHRRRRMRGHVSVPLSHSGNVVTRTGIYSILFYPIILEGRRGTTDEFATIPFHLDLFSAALVELAKSIPVHSLILSSDLFFCLPLFLFPFTVPCRIVFAKPEDLETWPNHLSFRFLTRVRSSSFSPMAAWIFLRTSSLVTWSLYEMFNSLR